MCVAGVGGAGRVEREEEGRDSQTVGRSTVKKLPVKLGNHHSQKAHMVAAAQKPLRDVKRHCKIRC